MTHLPKTPEPVHSEPRRGEDQAGLRHFRQQIVELEDLWHQQHREFQELLAYCAELLRREQEFEQNSRELEQDLNQRESRCREATQRLAAEYEQLADGWDRLENTQRQLLATGATLPRSAAGEASPAAQQIFHPAASGTVGQSVPIAPHAAQSARPATVLSNLSRSSSDLDINDNWEPQQGEAAALQFAQMKRQIRNHIAGQKKK